MGDAWRDEIKARSSLVEEAKGKTKVAERLARAYKRLQAHREKAFEDAIAAFSSGDDVPARGPWMFADCPEVDPVEETVEKVLIELLGDAYRPARADDQVAAGVGTPGAPVFADGPELGTFDSGGRAVLTDAGVEAFAEALDEAARERRAIDAERSRAVREDLAIEPSGVSLAKAAKTRSKLAGAAKVPTATVEAPDEAERVGCRKAEPPAAEEDADDWSSLWAKPWAREFEFAIGGATKTVECGYRVYHGTGEFMFGQPLHAAGYGTYGMGKVGDGVPQFVPAAWRKRPIEYARLLTYHLCRLTAVAGLEPSDAPDAPAWRSTPIDDLVAINPVARETLRRCGVKTAGDVADAIDLQADDVRTDLDTEAVEIPDGPWKLVVEAIDTHRDPSGRTALARSSAAEEEGSERRRAELTEAYLADALWPEGCEAKWAAMRETGASNVEISAELARLWPGVHTHVEGSPGEPGYTIVGGGWPVFWLGSQVAGPNRMPAYPGLHGPELMDAIRRVLRLPELVDPMAAAPKAAKPKSRKRKAKEAVH